MENKKIKKLKIGIDIDDVTCEFVRPYLDFHNKKFKTNFIFDQITKPLFWESFGIDQSKMQEYFDDFQNNYLLLEEFPLVNGVKEAINKLSKIGEIFFITARPFKLISRTQTFLDKNFPDVHFELIHSGDLHGGKKNKSEICKELGINILIDDISSFCEDCSKKGIKVFLFDKPWNNLFNEKDYENITRVKNWEEVLNKMNL
jgi:uncharacterized protein